jgi:hypothetical protein
MESYARWVGLTDPLGHSVPASLTQISYEAGPTAPMALFFWVGPTTRWVDLTQSHPDWTSNLRLNTRKLQRAALLIRLTLKKALLQGSTSARPCSTRCSSI